MVKNIANQFLASSSNIMEYDLSKAKNMNNGLLVPMVMLWVLHFKMGQVQPLFFQTASGVKELVFSPLFQVYVLGKNLERPFVNKKLEDLQKQQEELGGVDGDVDGDSVSVSGGEKGEEETEEDETVADDDDDDSDEDSSDDDSDESDEDSSEDDDEYDEEYDDEYD
jgi:hypothetical protein